MLQQVCKPGQATTALPQQTPKGSHLHVVCIHCCSGCAVLAPHPPPNQQRARSPDASHEATGHHVLQIAAVALQTGGHNTPGGQTAARAGSNNGAVRRLQVGAAA